MRKTSLLLSGALALGTVAQAEGACPVGNAHISIPNGSYSSQPGVTFALRHFTATLVPMGKTSPSCYQKWTDVSQAEIFISNESLTHVFADKLATTDSKIRAFHIENGLGKVTLSGEMVKVVPLKFSIAGPVTTDGTKLLIDVGKIDADGIPVQALLAMVGDHLSSVLGFKGVGGVSVEGNVMSFDPAQIAHLRGHIASVETSAEGLTLRYDREAAASPHRHGLDSR